MENCDSNVLWLGFVSEQGDIASILLAKNWQKSGKSGWKIGKARQKLRGFWIFHLLLTSGALNIWAYLDVGDTKCRWCDQAKWVWSQKFLFLYFWHLLLGYYFKGIVSDSNNIFLWQQLEDNNEKGYFQNFSSFQFFVYKLCMILCIGIAP